MFEVLNGTFAEGRADVSGRVRVMVCFSCGKLAGYAELTHSALVLATVSIQLWICSPLDQTGGL